MSNFKQPAQALFLPLNGGQIMIDPQDYYITEDGADEVMVIKHNRLLEVAREISLVLPRPILVDQQYNSKTNFHFAYEMETVLEDGTFIVVVGEASDDNCRTDLSRENRQFMALKRCQDKFITEFLQWRGLKVYGSTEIPATAPIVAETPVPETPVGETPANETPENKSEAETKTAEKPEDVKADEGKKRTRSRKEGEVKTQDDAPPAEKTPAEPAVQENATPADPEAEFAAIKPDYGKYKGTNTPLTKMEVNDLKWLAGIKVGSRPGYGISNNSSANMKVWHEAAIKLCAVRGIA